MSAGRHRTSIYGSAVCVYNMASIERAFRGPYKSQADAKAAWTRVSSQSDVDNDLCRRTSTLADSSSSTGNSVSTGPLVDQSYKPGPKPDLGSTVYGAQTTQQLTSCHEAVLIIRCTCEVKRNF